MYILLAIFVLFILIAVLYNIGKQREEKNRQNSQTGFQYNVTVNSQNKNSVDNSIGWELVRRKSERWKELGFGDGESFSGYGISMIENLKLRI